MYENELNKEKIMFFSSNSINKNEELMAFALYNLFYNSIKYSLDNNSILDKYHELMIKYLDKYNNKLSKNNIKLNSKEYMLGYIKELKDWDFPKLNEEYKNDINNIIDSLKWVNNINNKLISFSDKVDIVTIINDYFINARILFGNFVKEDKADKMYNDYRITILSFNEGIDYDEFSNDIFIKILNEISRDFINNKINEKEIDLNNINDDSLNEIYNSFDNNGKKILIYLISYTFTNYSNIPLESYFNPDRLSNELGLSKFKTKLVMYKFINNWINLIKKEESIYVKKIKKSK